MTDNHVPAHGTAKLDRVEGDLRVGRRARLESASGKITVSGGVYFEGGAEVNCSLECDNVSMEHSGSVKINGDLTVRKELDIVHSIEVSGATKAGSIIGEGKIRSNSIEAKRIRANGVMEVKKSLVAEESIEVTGKLDSPGQINLHDLTMTGQAMVGGGQILGRIEVRGKFEAKSKIEFGDIHILGTAKLPSGCEGKKASTFGKLIVEGDIRCDQFEMQGTAIVEGNCDSVKAWIKGKFEVSGSLSATEILETLGSTEVSQMFTGGNLRVGGKLFANQVFLTGEADVGGRLETKQGLKAKTLIVRSGSRCQGPIVAESVEIAKSYMNMRSWQSNWMGQNISMRLIGKETKVHDVYATNVHLGVASSADRIFAQNVQVERGCVVDKITYAGELKLPEGPKSTYMNHPPEKVEKMPTPPL